MTIDLQTFEHLVRGAKADYLARVKINLDKLDKSELVMILDNAPLDRWVETHLTGTPRYWYNAIPNLDINLEEISSRPVLRVIHPDLPVSNDLDPTRILMGKEVDKLYSKVDAHFAMLREQKLLMFYKSAPELGIFDEKPYGTIDDD